MENKEKIRVAFAIASIAAISIFFTLQYRRRQDRKRHSKSCYLHTEPKPQSSFKRVFADNSYSPFKHLKLNDTDNENITNSHPYQAEITSMLENPEVKFSFINGNMDLKKSDLYVWVETEGQLRELVDALSKERVFAVDTEQHSLRSFLGFTALIQISTHEEDYLVDTIALHDVMGILCPVFADPNICKVFHGADNDVLWLQRDFHIYIVNLFDTAKACEVLSKPHKSLAYLLEIYCGVTTNKMLQREDWRQRPLSTEMVQYARTDARYLLYIANCLIVELKQQDSDIKVPEGSSCPDDKSHFLIEANRRSNTLCLQLYTKEIEASPGESVASSIFSKRLTGQGLASKTCETQFHDRVRRLCAWRDLMARIHDESLRYVLSDQAIIALAEQDSRTETEIFDIISHAELDTEPLSFNSSIPSPSSVVCTHLEDMCYLFQVKSGNLDDIFQRIPEKHVGPHGSCPLSVFNYALLSKSNLKLANRLVSKQNGIKKSKQVDRRASRQLFVQKFSCKSPVYHNCRIYADDGRLLCYCDRRKLEWYLRRDLAKLLDENPPAIMLLFEPKGRPEDEGNEFYVQTKKNKCVGCGERNHYLRYRIIPSCYRVHFPEHLKSHRSHDIVLLCVDCHEVAHSASERYKKKIAAEFGIPLFIQRVVDSKEAEVTSRSSASTENPEEAAGVSPLQLRSAAMALLRHGSRMPSKRREELTQVVMQYYGGREITEKDLERALLVGMSPHERRRLDKKRGLSFEHSAGRMKMLPEKEFENNTSCASTYTIPDELEVDSIDESESHITQEDVNLSTMTDIDSELGGDVSTADIKDMESDKSKVIETEEISESPSLSNGTVDLSYPKADGSASQHSSKLSLLGHGPHGKQVVDHILGKYGEDGIGLFCQRWRQVFVEAIHPRYLPAGWDVMHSGRRDFGEFSVYNQEVKKASGIVKG